MPQCYDVPGTQWMTWMDDIPPQSVYKQCPSCKPQVPPVWPRVRFLCFCFFTEVVCPPRRAPAIWHSSAWCQSRHAHTPDKCFRFPSRCISASDDSIREAQKKKNTFMAAPVHRKNKKKKTLKLSYVLVSFSLSRPNQSNLLRHTQHMARIPFFKMTPIRSKCLCWLR